MAKTALAALGVAAGAAAVGLAFRKMVRAGAGFEHTMARVKALTGATGDAFEALRRQAKQLGITTQFSASQAGEAMAFFALAGHDVQSILNEMPATLNLAAAGQLQVGEAADIAAKIMAGMGHSASMLQRDVDILAAAFTTSNTDLRMLGDAMSYVGPVARGLEKPLEEVTAAIQVLSNAGLQGEKAGSALRMMLLKMANPTKQAQKVMKQLGVSFVDSTGQMKALPTIIDNLNRSMKGLGAGARVGVLAQLFEARAATGAVSLLEAGGDALRDFQTALENAGGTAERVAKTQLDTLTGDWVKMKSALEGLAITIYEDIQPGLRLLVQGITGTIQRIIRFSDHIDALSESFERAVQGMISGLGDMLEWIHKIDKSGGLDRFIRNVQVGFLGIVATAKAAFQASKVYIHGIQTLFEGSSAWMETYLNKSARDVQKRQARAWEIMLQQYQKGEEGWKRRAKERAPFIHDQPMLGVWQMAETFERLEKAQKHMRQLGKSLNVEAFLRRELESTEATAQSFQQIIDRIAADSENAFGRTINSIEELMKTWDDLLDKVGENLPEHARKGILGGLGDLIEQLRGDAEGISGLGGGRGGLGSLAGSLDQATRRSARPAALERGTVAAYSAGLQTDQRRDVRSIVKYTGKTAELMASVDQLLREGNELSRGTPYAVADF